MRKQLYIVFVLSLIMVSCTNPDRQVSDELENTVADFERLYDVRVDYPVRVVDHDIDALGRCFGAPVMKGVEISRKVLEEYPEELEMVVFHELAHCSFDVPHVDVLTSVKSKFGKAQAKSYMHSVAAKGRYDVFPKEYYREELREQIARTGKSWGKKIKIVLDLSS